MQGYGSGDRYQEEKEANKFYKVELFCDNCECSADYTILKGISVLNSDTICSNCGSSNLRRREK